MFEGDTIYAQSEILSKRESKSRPHMGLVEIRTIGFKQDGTVVMSYRRTIMVYKRGHETKVAGTQAGCPLTFVTETRP